MSSASASFRVVYLGKVREKLKEILQKAKKVGKLERCAQALLEMNRRLAQDPLGLGELKATLRRMNVLVHVGFVRPLLVEFGVQEQQRIVFVKRIEAVTSLEQ